MLCQAVTLQWLDQGEDLAAEPGRGNGHSGALCGGYLPTSMKVYQDGRNL